jgi:hypothetical protein
VMSVLVAAAIVVVFFVPLPHVSLFHSLVTPAKVTAPTRLPVVDLSATPAGWVAVADGDVQISVPPTWGPLQLGVPNWFAAGGGSRQSSCSALRPRLGAEEPGLALSACHITY